MEHYLDKEKRLYLAKSFVLGSIINSEKLYQIDASEYLEKLKQASSIQEVMQVEGSFRKLCYKALEELTGWEF